MAGRVDVAGYDEAMARSARTTLSEHEFLRLPESLDRIELLDGEVVVSPSPTFLHQEIIGRLGFALRAWAAGQGGPLTIGHAPLDVRFAPGRILQPDLFLIFERIPLGHQGPLDRIPALCIEVLSRNASYDRFTKRLIYAEAGVAELWTVEPGYYVERWNGDALRTVTKLERTLVSELLPGFELELDELFSGMR